MEAMLPTLVVTQLLKFKNLYQPCRPLLSFQRSYYLKNIVWTWIDREWLTLHILFYINLEMLLLSGGRFSTFQSNKLNGVVGATLDGVLGLTCFFFYSWEKQAYVFSFVLYVAMHWWEIFRNLKYVFWDKKMYIKIMIF